MTMTVSALYVVFLCIIHGDGFELKENMKFEEVDCDSLQIESYCTASQVNNWCIWNEQLSICQKNYESVLFISPWDLVAVTKSAVALIISVGVMILYYMSGLITRNVKVFKNIEPDKRSKCQIYVFEIIGLTISMTYLLYAGTFNTIFTPQNYTALGPKASLDLVRSLSTSALVIQMYAVEMLTNTLRWSLQLHHSVVIFVAIYFISLLDSADLASLRCILSISIYPFTEHNVFAQLLLYRAAPLYSWKIHFVSAIFYTVTRIFGTVTFIVCYIQWAMTDRIYGQFHGDKLNIHYMGFFFMMPIATFLLVLAQYQTVKALFYLSRSIRKRIKIRTELRKNPRLQKLYDMFNTHCNDGGYWTMMEFKKFIFYNSTFIKHETCIILWNVLGFTNFNDPEPPRLDSNESMTESLPPASPITVNDISGFEDKINIKQTKKRCMKWKDFRGIFGKHVLDEKLMSHSVKQVVHAQLQVLLQTIFKAQSRIGHNIDAKDEEMLRLYNQVNEMIIDGDKNTKHQQRISKRLSRVSKVISVELTQKESTEIYSGNMEDAEVMSAMSSAPRTPPPTIEMYIDDGNSPDDITFGITLDDARILDKQLELDDAMRANTERMSSLISPPQRLQSEQTI